MRPSRRHGDLETLRPREAAPGCARLRRPSARAARHELESDPEFAASARWRFRHLFVDEYQDVNPAQVRLLDAWLGDNDDLCVVGDPDQAIYAWNGSDPRALIDFPRRYPGSQVVRLAVNYRSTDAVLAVASSVLTAEPTLGAGPRSDDQRGCVERAQPQTCSWPVPAAGRCRRIRSSPTRPTPTRPRRCHRAATGPQLLARLVEPRRPRSHERPARALRARARGRGHSVPKRRRSRFLARPAVRRALDRLTSAVGSPRHSRPGSKSWLARHPGRLR